MNVGSITGWIFDMDGTLTVPIHDFVVIRRELAMPADRDDILGWLDSLSEDERQQKDEILKRIELDLARQSKPQPFIHELLEQLQNRGCHLGVITRNNLLNTKVTLKAAGLDSFFDIESIRTRECAPAKPDPEAVFQLLNLWGTEANQTVICGDYKHDLNAGINGGIHTIYFNSRNDEQWKVLADLTIESWDELLRIL